MQDVCTQIRKCIPDPCTHILNKNVMKWVWQPRNYTDKNKTCSMLENGCVHRSSSRFIARDYKCRQAGCVSAMIDDLNIHTLQERRGQQRLALLYKVVVGHVPAINI
ncbi:hypothetical protein DPMN_102627 [Dreissena polymorpha]|uniref:Uncharacterized protein n=1 Tax=Dreissena polymorpha TaxID=45954 RepID=A0A9D4LKZ5_DREPO|nr:hypothetical protein DPMN_102627 [Dreissena polymorpha]